MTFNPDNTKEHEEYNRRQKEFNTLLIKLLKEQNFLIKDFSCKKERENFMGNYPVKFFKKSYLVDGTIENPFENKEVAFAVVSTFVRARDGMYEEYPQFKSHRVMVANLKTTYKDNKEYISSKMLTIVCNLLITGEEHGI